MNPELRSDPYLACHLDLTPMSLDELFDNSQSQARPTGGSITGLFRSPETVEEVR